MKGAGVRMCKMVEDLQKETAIFATIKSCRRRKVLENEILIEIRDEFNLTAAEAEAYIQKSREGGDIYGYKYI